MFKWKKSTGALVSGDSWMYPYQESLYKPYKYHGYTVRGTPNCPLIVFQTPSNTYVKRCEFGAPKDVSPRCLESKHGPGGEVFGRLR